MNAKIKIMLMLIMLMPLAYAVSSGTFSYFSDVETSFGNTFIAGTWDVPEQADDLVVDTSNAHLTGNGKKLHRIILNNTGTNNITIVELNVGWTLDGGEEIVNVEITGKDGEWSGNASSGTLLDISDCTISPVKAKRTDFSFDSNMEGKEFTIVFFMGDGSWKEVEVTFAL